jgi:hypothetical protein
MTSFQFVVDESMTKRSFGNQWRTTFLETVQQHERAAPLQVIGSEYLGMDVMAFPEGMKRWRFPSGVIELENSQNDDRVAYSLWKVLAVRADLRIVFCYRRSTAKGSALIRSLREEVIEAMGIAGRMKLEGEIVVVVGSYDNSSTFPYGFFKWWQLDSNTGMFTQS